MTMRKRAGSLLFTAAAAAAVVSMSVGPALAATHLTVRVSHGGSYTAKAGKTLLTDHGISVTCTSSHASGRLPSGTHRGTAPVRLGPVSRLSFSNCAGPLGPVMTHVVLKPVLNADSKTNRRGQTDAIITNVKVNVSMTGCSFTVTGSAPGVYSNRTHTLTMEPRLPIRPIKRAQLTVSGVATGTCGGLINNGDHPTYKASYKVSLRRLTIKSS